MLKRDTLTMTPFTHPAPPFKPDYHDVYVSQNFHDYQAGECTLGTAVRVFIPESPYRSESGLQKVVIYLHGFVLVPLEIYYSHITHLVKQGFYVFYPFYQRGFCLPHESFWNNLAEMIHAALTPYPVDAAGWVLSAINSVQEAYPNIEGLDNNAETYLFGHSLGGLQALSWLYFARKDWPDFLYPKQVVVADPIPTSDGNIPEPIRSLLNVLGAFQTKLKIQDTGEKLTVPVAILHGDSDEIVPIKVWQELFHCIESRKKKFYYARTDDHGRPIMNADHMQATVNTSFFPDWMSRMFLGGVGVENNLNWRYVWYALDQVVHEKFLAHELVFNMGEWSDGKRVLNPLEGFEE